MNFLYSLLCLFDPDARDLKPQAQFRFIGNAMLCV